MTNEGETQSEVLVSKGHDWVARFGMIENQTLVSGRSVSNKGFDLHAILVDPREKFPQLKACDAAVDKQVLAQFKGPELMLLTDSAAFYESEDCDICASLDVCDLKTHQVRRGDTDRQVLDVDRHAGTPFGTAGRTRPGLVPSHGRMTRAPSVRPR